MMQNKKKILVVDDDAGILEVIKIVLVEKNFEVLTASEGLGVIPGIEKNLPDVILIDLWMSGMDGDEVIKKIKCQKKMSDIPVIAMSALENGEKRAEEAGADDFLAKPFDIDELASLVEKYATGPLV